MGTFMYISGGAVPAQTFDFLLSRLNPSNDVVFEAYEFDLANDLWNLLGETIMPATIEGGSIWSSEMSPENIATYANGSDNLTTTNFDGSSFSLVGTPRNFVNEISPTVARLSDNKIVLTDNTTTNLGVYEWDGSNWNLLANTDIGINKVSKTITALTDTGIVGVLYWDAGTGLSKIDAWELNPDNTFTQQGSTYEFNEDYHGRLATGSGPPIGITYLNSTNRIAIHERLNGRLIALETSGIGWQEIGNPFPASLRLSGNAIQGFEPEKLVGITPSNSLKVFDFDGVNFSQIGAEFPFSSGNQRRNICRIL